MGWNYPAHYYKTIQFFDNQIKPFPSPYRDSKRFVPPDYLLTEKQGINLNFILHKYVQKELYMKELITLKDLAEKYGVSRQTIHNWRKDKSFPKPKLLARRHCVWDPVAVDKWYNGE